MKTNIERLHELIASLAPIDSVSIGRWNDKETWRIDFKEEATDEQKQLAQTTLENFDPNYFTDDELKIIALEKAAIYTSKYFNQDQINAMLLELLGGNIKAQAVVGWTKLIKIEALNNFKNPNFDQFDPPPHSYLDVMGVTL